MRYCFIRIEDITDGKRMVAEIRLSESQVRSAGRIDKLFESAFDLCNQKLDCTPEQLDAITMRQIGECLPALAPCGG